jgi:hypothetical protein
MCDRTYGGAGRKYAGSSGERGKLVAISTSVLALLNVRDIVIASRGLPQMLVQNARAKVTTRTLQATRV